MADTMPVAIVTGASRGLGRGIAVRLAERGFSIVVNFSGNTAAAGETVELCRSRQSQLDQRFIPFQADMAVHEQRVRLVEQTLSALGRIDVLVNNAGIGPLARADITETTLESFEHVLRVNLEGPYFLTQAVANYWLSQRPDPVLPHGFSIVNISSISANTVSLNRGEYCVSKSGLSMVTQLWAARLASSRIQVFELRPGIMATDMTAGVKEKYDRLLGDGLVPQNRWGSPDDVGKAVSAIVTGSFPYSTGSVIYLDGGMHIRRF
jgi:NAD(P)-dependent dehydrogenase (short-subunit alcohol dehydrogenase family)